ncbi:MAG: tRNA (adenosine(37)-N6)-threonylcarbamoyltransferase complex dimerization subunit type 1 TsaB, partial [Propionibacteriaceae bacterium]|nr:tRNA (adenosine(37)-N6)-threonylcarbamoyltransferase complex dimerization subunit type 1 TsaB [Propionibacteriaceae bacterium]
MTETILGIDTSTVVSVGLARDGAIIEHCAVGDSRSHLEQLVPTIQAVLERAGLTTANLTGVAVGMGPGPFTGLRAGIAAAEMLAYVHQIPLIRVCSLDILGLSWAGTAPEGDFVGCTDARRKELYWAVYDAQGHRQSGPFVSTPTALPNLPRIGPGVPDHGSGQSSGQRDGDASREQNKFTCSAEAKETVDERSEEHGSTGQRDGSAVS